MIKFAAILLLLSLAACQIPPAEQDSSPFFLVPEGSRLVLNQDFQIPPYRFKIFVQSGRLAYGANQYHPYCRFSVQETAAHPQLVKADEFEIYRTRRVTSLFAALSPTNLFAGVFSGGRGKPTSVIYGTEMDLRSSSQPRAFQLMCGHLQDPNLTARYLSVAQMQQAMGEVFTLKLPE